MLAHWLVATPGLRWHVVGHYLFESSIRTAVRRTIVLPQAMRVIIPPTGNETISMLKTTSLVEVIGYAELTFTAQIIGSRTFQVIPLFITISIWYVAMTSVLYVGQYYLERYFARGSQGGLPPTPLQRIRRLAARSRPASRKAAA